MKLFFSGTGPEKLWQDYGAQFPFLLVAYPAFGKREETKQKHLEALRSMKEEASSGTPERRRPEPKQVAHGTVSPSVWGDWFYDAQKSKWVSRKEWEARTDK